jgi:protein-S-isoprenylcysteine O-methyltransferase Ste14
VLAVWGIVNAVNLVQGLGFVSRVTTGARAINHTLGFGIILLVVPAIAALVALRGAGWLGWVGPAMFVVFVALMVWVDYLFPVEFRSPQRPSILVPYLVLFFGSILLMGLQMYAVDRRLWLVTVATTALHLVAMGLAMMRGVG